MTTKKGGKTSHLSVCLFICLSVVCAFVCSFGCSFVCLFIYLFVWLVISLQPSAYLFICLSVCLFVHLSLPLSECPFVRFPSVCLLTVYMSRYLSLRISANCCFTLILLLHQTFSLSYMQWSTTGGMEKTDWQNKKRRNCI